jgi:hypothetical protein
MKPEQFVFKKKIKANLASQPEEGSTKKYQSSEDLAGISFPKNSLLEMCCQG